MKTPCFTLSGIDKSFPGVKALSNVSLELYAGEVTALIGENGAGKSTLVKILTGIYQPDAGQIQVKGKSVKLTSAQDAFSRGITAIHQETVLFDDLSVAENIYLGHTPRGRFGLLDLKSMHKAARKVLDQMHANHIDTKTHLRELSIANKHLVAVARALSVDAKIVVMDEPTAALSAKEIEELYQLIEVLKQQGKAILFISHKFDEIFRIADRYTVFRDGTLVGHGLLKDTTQNNIIKLMVGRSVDHIFPTRKTIIGETLLQISDLSHPTEFDDVTFELFKGEILGFYGLVGAGRSELMQAIFGITNTSSGTITLNGRPCNFASPSDAIEAGIVYVPEERGRQGVVLGLPIFMNVSLPSLSTTSKSGVLRLRNELALAREFTQRLDLRASSLSQDVATLSGGNQQKVVIAKWLATAPHIIILDEPTKGIDIGSKAAVHEFMGELVARGLSVIMVSSELPEILGMADRVIVMREGKIAGVFENKNLMPETLVKAAAGVLQ
jgi:rhamnose transport system ATP-binding protein